VKNTPPLPDQLRAARDAKGWTQVQAAIKLGCDPNTWARWEQGRARPDILTLERIAKLLGRRLVIELR